MTDLLFFEISTGEISEQTTQEAIDNAPPHAVNRYAKTTLLAPKRHRLHDNDAPGYKRGLHHSITFTPSIETEDFDTKLDAYTAGTFTHTYTIYTDGIAHGFLPNSILPKPLPAGTYDHTAFTESDELLIASNANHFKNFVELVKHHFGSFVGLHRDNMATFYDRLNTAEKKITASQPDESVPNDKERRPLYKFYMATNPTSTVTLEQFDHVKALAYAKSVVAQASALHTNFAQIWHDAQERVSHILNSENTTEAGNRFQEAIRWFYSQYTKPTDFADIVVIGREAQALKHSEFNFFPETDVGSEHIIQLKCAIRDGNMPAGESKYKFGIKNIDGSLISIKPPKTS